MFPKNEYIKSEIEFDLFTIEDNYNSLGGSKDSDTSGGLICILLVVFNYTIRIITGGIEFRGHAPYLHVFQHTYYFLPVRERLAEALLFLYSTYGFNEKEFSIAISREDLASIIGTSKETATRFLTEFKEDSILTTRGSNIRILDKEKLVKISQLYD